MSRVTFFVFKDLEGPLRDGSPGSKSGDQEARELRTERAFWPGFQGLGRGKASSEAEGRRDRLLD